MFFPLLTSFFLAAFSFVLVMLFLYIGQLEQLQLVYTLRKETVTAIMILYKNKKAMLGSSDGNTNFFHIVTSVL